MQLMPTFVGQSKYDITESKFIFIIDILLNMQLMPTFVADTIWFCRCKSKGVQSDIDGR
jgi:hypothetical protein